MALDVCSNESVAAGYKAVVEAFGKVDILINAAGLWAREVAALAGIALPLMPVEHHYLVTEAIPDVTGEKKDLEA